MPFHFSEDDLEQLLQTSEESFQALAGARLLLTGGTGFIGQWLVASILYANDRMNTRISVEILSRRARKLTESWQNELQGSTVSLTQADVTSPFKITAAPDFIVHGAAETGSGIDPVLVHETIVQGALNLASLIRDYDVQRALFLSSGAVYDTLSLQRPALESDSVMGKKPAILKNYSSAKQISETTLSEVGAISARCFAFAGPGLPLRAHFAIGNFINDALEDQTTVIRGDGQAVRSYMYPTDLASWLWHLLLKGQPGTAYNVGSGEAISIANLARTVAAELGNSHQVVVQNSEHSATRNYYIPDVSQAQALGLEVKVSLHDAIRKTASWVSATGFTS